REAADLRFGPRYGLLRYAFDSLHRAPGGTEQLPLLIPDPRRGKKRCVPNESKASGRFPDPGCLEIFGRSLIWEGGENVFNQEAPIPAHRPPRSGSRVGAAAAGLDGA